ncbi:MAG: S-layer homology domain-containing protein [Defluviitaleaceae bacterium]|nr:S-layer homology domain-containing protein [Defluviitaleaceae bacterium]
MYKKMMAYALVFVLVALTVIITPQEIATANPQRAQAFEAYYNILRDYINRYGIVDANSTWRIGVEVAGRSWDDRFVPAPTGVHHAALIDFNNDGIPELFITYSVGDDDGWFSRLDARVYGFVNGQPNILHDTGFGSGGESFIERIRIARSSDGRAFLVSGFTNPIGSGFRIYALDAGRIVNFVDFSAHFDWEHVETEEFVKFMSQYAREVMEIEEAPWESAVGRINGVTVSATDIINTLETLNLVDISDTRLYSNAASVNAVLAELSAGMAATPPTQQTPPFTPPPVQISPYGRRVAEEFLMQFRSIFIDAVHFEETWHDGEPVIRIIDTATGNEVANANYRMYLGRIGYEATNANGIASWFSLYDFNNSGIPDIIVDYSNLVMSWPSSILFRYVSGAYRPVANTTGMDRFYYDESGQIIAIMVSENVYNNVLENLYNIYVFHQTETIITTLEHIAFHVDRWEDSFPNSTIINPLTALENEIRASVTQRLLAGESAQEIEEPENEEDGVVENNELPEVFQTPYIHIPPPVQYIFTPPQPIELTQVISAGSATAAISNTVAELSPEQRRSGDAINITTLYIENATRRGTTQTMPNEGITAETLRAGAEAALDIQQNTASILDNEDITLFRNPRTNINFVSAEPEELQISFPDDVSEIEFDNVSIEADFAMVTVNREFMQQGGEVGVRQISIMENQAESMENAYNETAPITNEPESFLHTATDVSEIGVLGVLVNFWSIAVIFLLLIVWIVLLNFGKKLPIWVVPAVSLVVIAINVGILWLTFQPTEATQTVGRSDVLSALITPRSVNAVEVTMTEGMRATLSLPANGSNPEALILFNAQGEPQFGRYNPVTGNIDSRIRTGGVYTLREYNVSFADIEGRSALMQNAILQLASRGIMRGTGDYFHPDDLINRTEFVSAIIMAFDMLDFELQVGFADISPDAWYYHAIATAEHKNLISGFPDNTFRGHLEIPKDQLIVIAARTLVEQMDYNYPEDVEYFLSRFLDRPYLATWSEDGIALSTATNIILHRADSMFQPQSEKTRGDAAIVLYRVFSRVW